MTTFAELATNGALYLSDGYRTRRDELGDPGYPILRVAEVGDGSITPSYGDHVRQEFGAKIGLKLARAGDVLLTTKGTVGRRAIVPHGAATFAYSPQLCFFRTLDGSVDGQWLYYWLGSIEFWSQATGVSQQTDMAPYISLSDLRRIDVKVPPIPEQRAIAATLGALDDKIESNRRLAITALDLAEAVYVRSCKQDSTRMRLAEVGSWLSGGTPPTSNGEFWDGDLPWISAASLKSLFVWDSDRRLTPAGAEQATHVVPAGSVLIVVRGMSLKSELRLGLTQRDVAFGQDCKAILPTIPGPLLAVALRHSRSAILQLVDEAGHGTGRLSTDLLTDFVIEVPNDPYIVSTVEALVARGASAERESAHLAALRDTLLPELISGRIRVDDLSEFQEDGPWDSRRRSTS